MKALLKAHRLLISMQWTFYVAMPVLCCFLPGQSSAAQAVGPLRVHPTNPRYFIDGTKNPDGSLKPIYLTGSHLGWELQDDAWGREHVFDYDGFLDFLVRHNHNLIRLWVVEHTRWDTSNPKAVATPMPYRRVGPDKALDGGLKFDLKQLNPDYFKRLRSRVQTAGQRGIYVLVMLFQGFSIHKRPGRNPWFGHPFNKHNNVNDIDGDVNGDGDGREVHTLRNSRVTALQQAYVRQVIDMVNDLDNVLYEIANEAGIYSTDWQYQMIRYVKKYEAQKPKQHPVGMTVQIPGGHNNNDILFRSPADWISPNNEGGYRNDPPAADGRKIILIDTDHLWGVGGKSRQWVWKSFCRGLNPIYMDSYTDQETKQRDKIADQALDPKWEPIRLAMGYSRTLANRINLVPMTPRNDLSSTKYCLANPRCEYIVYQPTSNQPFRLKLKVGTYRFGWFNPRTGKFADKGKITTKDGEQIFDTPFEGDAVIYLKRLSNCTGSVSSIN